MTFQHDSFDSVHVSTPNFNLIKIDRQWMQDAGKAHPNQFLNKSLLSALSDSVEKIMIMNIFSISCLFLVTRVCIQNHLIIIIIIIVTRRHCAQAFKV